VANDSTCVGQTNAVSPPPGETIPLMLDAKANVPNPLEVPRTSSTIDKGTPVDLERLLKGQVRAIVLAANVVRGPRTPAGIAADRRGIEAKLTAIEEMALSHADKAALAMTPDDVRRIAASGRTAIILALTGAHALGEDIAGVEALHRRGVRVLGLVHTGNNAFVDSSRPYGNESADEHGGLSTLGQRAISEANRLGMLIDVSQYSTAAVFQATELSKAPVVASHSAVRALVDHPRNLLDQEIRAIAKTGGVVGIVAFSLYLRNLTQEEMTAREEITQRYGGLRNGYEGLSIDSRQAYYRELVSVTRRANLNDYLNAVDYVVNLVGIDHVALSSDFNQGGGIEGWSDASEAPNVTAALVKRGYTPAQICKLWGENFLRAWGEAQALAVH
jgi:membrane dipeptidase